MIAILVDVLLAFSVLLTLLCAVGVWAMPDPYQKLHFLAPPSTLAAAAIAAALFLGEKERQAGAKALLVLLVLGLINAVVTHASAHAFRVRERGRWEIAPEERIPIVGEETTVGAER